MKVEIIEKWNEIEPKLRERNYSPWQFQYDINQAEGFHVLFSTPSPDLPDVEIITHDPAVRAAIGKYNQTQK